MGTFAGYLPVVCLCKGPMQNRQAKSLDVDGHCILVHDSLLNRSPKITDPCHEIQQYPQQCVAPAPGRDRSRDSDSRPGPEANEVSLETCDTSMLRELQVISKRRRNKCRVFRLTSPNSFPLWLWKTLQLNLAKQDRIVEVHFVSAVWMARNGITIDEWLLAMARTVQL